MHGIPIISTTVEVFIHQATRDIISLLAHLPKSVAPIIQLGDTGRNVLLQVNNILNSNQVTSAVLKSQHQITANAEARLSPPGAPQ